MQRLNIEAFEKLLAETKLVAGSSQKPRILSDETGHIYKIFYKRKGWSSSHVWPHAKRFARNAKQCASRNVLAPNVVALYTCPKRNCHIVKYAALPGMDVRDSVAKGDMRGLESLPLWMAELHRKGVFFRGIHLGNILQSTAAEFALLDIADMRFRNRPISMNQRARNIIHLFKNRDDREVLNRFGLGRFMALYFAASALSEFKQQRLSKLIARKLR